MRLREGALWNRLFQPWPVGLSLREFYASVGQLDGDLAKQMKRLDKGEESVLEDAMITRLIAGDRESLVILGDPTATLPPLPSKRA